MADIRPVRTIDEFLAVEQLQQTVWNVVDRELVPALHLIPSCAVGGILLGAFDRDRMIGFVYGFPGFEGDERIIHSDMLAVLREYRGHGIGQQLKLAQREAALQRGVRKITWTFDPLQARNAHLNFNRLGVTADRYLRDFYGETTSPLHRGIGTDRLWVTWDLAQERGATARRSAVRRVEIPSDVTTLPLEEAIRWREKTRRELEEAFASELIVTAFEQGAYVLSPRFSVHPER